MIHPVGTRVRWSSRNKAPRNGSQTGSLAREWHQHGTHDHFPCVLWDGETEARQELPECVEIAQEQKASLRDAWAEARVR